MKTNKNNTLNTISEKKVEDIDIYNIKEGSPDSSNCFRIFVDFEDESIVGFNYYNGCLDHMIDTKECVELLESLIQFNRPMQRDITSILKKVKNDTTI